MEQKKRQFSLLIFTKNDSCEEVMTTICGSFQLEWDKKNTLLIKGQDQYVEIQVLCTFMGEKFAEYIKNTERGIAQHMAGFQVQNMDDVKLNLMHYITKAPTYIMINIIENDDSDNEESFQNTINAIMQMFTDSLKKLKGGVIAFGDGSTFYDENGNIIIADDGESEVTDYFPFVYEDAPERMDKLTANQLARRNRNVQKLLENQIYSMELPVNDDDEIVEIRSCEEIVKRAIGLLLVSLYSECLLSPNTQMSMAEAREYINDIAEKLSVTDLEDVLSPKEYAYIYNDESTKQEQISYSWCYENLYVLEWALGILDWTAMSQICDVPGCVRVIKEFDGISDMISKCKVKSKKDILDMADLVYRTDWACVEARIHGLTGPVGLDHGVVQERHRTLNWLIQFENWAWDDCSTPT